MTLAENLKTLRKEKNLTQSQLGEKLGIPFRTIMNWERGIREPSSQNMVLLERFFNVSGAYLRGETENRNEEKIWNDTLIMDEITKGLADLSINIINQAHNSTEEDQYYVFGVLSELLSILKLPNSKNKSTMLELAKLSIHGINNKEAREAAKKEA